MSVDERIWIECTCGYEGYADMVNFDGMRYSHPVCPDCGEMVYDIDYSSKVGVKK